MLVRDLLCIETIEGLVESGGDGRLDKGVLSNDVRELISVDVGAIDGD